MGSDPSRRPWVWALLIATIVVQGFATYIMCSALVTTHDGRAGLVTWGTAAAAGAVAALLAWGAATVRPEGRLGVQLSLAIGAISCNLGASGLAQLALKRWNPFDVGPGIAWAVASTYGLWSACIIGGAAVCADRIFRRT